METIKEKVDEKTKELDRKIRPWLWVFGVLLISMPFLLTQSWPGWIDFSTTGQIGDTIGGTLAPLVGFIGAILVYISFREQYKANVSQWSALEEEKRIRKDEQDEKRIENNQNLIRELIQRIEDNIYNYELYEAFPFAAIHDVDKNYSALESKIDMLLSDLSIVSYQLTQFSIQDKILINHADLYRGKISNIKSFFEKLDLKTSLLSEKSKWYISSISEDLKKMKRGPIRF